MDTNSTDNTEVIQIQAERSPEVVLSLSPPPEPEPEPEPQTESELHPEHHPAFDFNPIATTLMDISQSLRMHLHRIADVHCIAYDQDAIDRANALPTDPDVVKCSVYRFIELVSYTTEIHSKQSPWVGWNDPVEMVRVLHQRSVRLDREHPYTRDVLSNIEIEIAQNFNAGVAQRIIARHFLNVLLSDQHNPRLAHAALYVIHMMTLKKAEWQALDRWRLMHEMAIHLATVLKLPVSDPTDPCDPGYWCVEVPKCAGTQLHVSETTEQKTARITQLQKIVNDVLTDTYLKQSASGPVPLSRDRMDWQCHSDEAGPAPDLAPTPSLAAQKRAYNEDNEGDRDTDDFDDNALRRMRGKRIIHCMQTECSDDTSIEEHGRILCERWQYYYQQQQQ